MAIYIHKVISVGTRVVVDFCNVSGYFGENYVGKEGSVMDMQMFKTFNSYIVKFEDGVEAEYTGEELSII